MFNVVWFDICVEIIWKVSTTTGVNLIQTNTSNFQNFTKLHCTATHVPHILVFNILRSRVIKVSCENHNVFGLGVFHQFSPFVTPDLVFNEVECGKFTPLPSRCSSSPDWGWWGWKKTQLTHEKTFWRILWTLRWSCWPNFLRLSTFFADIFLQLWGRNIHFIDAYSPEKSYSSKMTVKTSLMVDMQKEEVFTIHSAKTSF